MMEGTNVSHKAITWTNLSTSNTLDSIMQEATKMLNDEICTKVKNVDRGSFVVVYKCVIKSKTERWGLNYQNYRERCGLPHVLS